MLPLRRELFEHLILVVLWLKVKESGSGGGLVPGFALQGTKQFRAVIYISGVV
jgi:hypothetical protein